MTSLIFFVLMNSIVMASMKIKALQKVSDHLKKKLMYSYVFRSLLQIYLVTCVLIFDQIIQGVEHFEYSIKLSTALFIPVFSWYYLKKNLERANNKEFSQKFGALYLGLNPMSSIMYMISTFFCIRRFLLALVTLFTENLLIVQLYIATFGSLLTLKLYIWASPMSSRNQNRIEKLNEVFTLFSTYFMISFTDFIQSVEYRYSLGFKAVVFILTIITINMAFVFYDQFTSLRIAYLKYKYQRAWKEY